MVHKQQHKTHGPNRLGYDMASEAVGRNWLVAACQVIIVLLIKSGIHLDLGPRPQEFLGVGVPSLMTP